MLDVHHRPTASAANAAADPDIFLLFFLKKIIFFAKGETAVFLMEQFLTTDGRLRVTSEKISSLR